MILGPAPAAVLQPFKWIHGAPACTPIYAWTCRHVHEDAGVLQYWTRASEQHWLACTAQHCGLRCSSFPQQGVCSPLERLTSRGRETELSQPLPFVQDLYAEQVRFKLTWCWRGGGSSLGLIWLQLIWQDLLTAIKRVCVCSCRSCLTSACHPDRLLVCRAMAQLLKTSRLGAQHHTQ